MKDATLLQRPLGAIGIRKLSKHSPTSPSEKPQAHSSNPFEKSLLMTEYFI
jgi:hypothetical protein